MTGFLSKFLGAELQQAKRMRWLFADVEKKHRGISKSIGQYVFEGENSSVLLTLDDQNLQAAWARNNLSRPLSQRFVHVFAQGVDWTPSQIARLGDVLAALQPLGAGYNWGVSTATKAPDWLRHIITAKARDDGKICDMQLLLDICAERQLSTDIILDILFSPNPASYHSNSSFSDYKGSDEWLRMSSEEITKSAPLMAAATRADLINTIAQLNLTAEYIDLVISGAVASAKSVREAATNTLTGADRSLLSNKLQEIYNQSTAGAKTSIVKLALRVMGADALPLLTGWKAEKNTAKVDQVIGDAIATLETTQSASEHSADSKEQYTALDGSTVDIPPMPPLPEYSRISEETMQKLLPSIESYNAVISAAKKEAKKGEWHWSKYERILRGDALAKMQQRAEVKTLTDVKGTPYSWMGSQAKFDRSGIDAFFASPDLTLRHLVMIAHQNSYWNLFHIFSDYFNTPEISELRGRVTAGADIRVLSALWVQSGGKDAIPVSLETRYYSSLENIEPEAIWPLVTDYFDLLEEALGFRPQSGATALNMNVALDFLALLPKVPLRFLTPLLSVATTANKAMQNKARDLLSDAQDIDSLIARVLGDGKQDVRAGAAQWLGQRGATSQIKALRQAVKTEKSDIAKAAMISALERLGDDISDFFNPAKMKKEAEAGLAKTKPKALDWFPIDMLPALKWNDGKTVDPVLVKWWVVLTNKLKQPGGNALVEIWLNRLAPRDAHKLGWFVLTSWIQQDTRTATPEEANEHAQANVDALLAQHQQWAKQHPQYAEYYVTDRDKLFEQLKREKLNTYLGSAAENKGLLALAGKVDGVDAANAARAFLKNHGSRVSQSKAVLDMLASNSDGAAIQIVLATANRFKARTVQSHAAGLIEDIANRRGWSPEELADRTIPTASLDETGVTELDCGQDRIYQMMLDENDTIVLINPAGKQVKALPAARVDEEKPVIAEAKKLLATAKKEIKQVIPAQSARLREAMCLERKWDTGDWQLYVMSHPIMARLARRLVWMGLDENDTCAVTFRPLDDGTFTDSDDNDVDITAFPKVQLAHSSLVSTSVRDAWRTHLADYEIKPPFDQLLRDLPILDSASAKDTVIEDRKGWMIETFKLRGAAMKAGYVRGAAEDGGVFFTYECRYQSTGLVALIEFSGSPLPEENMAGILFGLSFAKIRSGSTWHGKRVTLAEVPPVLLAECRQDLYDIADKGTGYDPDWEKKSPW